VKGWGGVAVVIGVVLTVAAVLMVVEHPQVVDADDDLPFSLVECGSLASPTDVNAPTRTVRRDCKAVRRRAAALTAAVGGLGVVLIGGGTWWIRRRSNLAALPPEQLRDLEGEVE
jgi:hypothetical protein